MSKTFTAISALDPEVLMIVDSLNLAFRWKHKGQLDFVEDYMRTVASLRKSYNAGKVVIASDWGGSAFRKELYPEYKSARKEKQALSTPEEQAEFELFFKEYEAVIEGFAQHTEFPTIRMKGVEADDIAAYIVKMSKKYKIKKIVLITSDRDWDLLLSAQVNAEIIRFSYVTRKELSLENWSEFYEWGPEEYISIKCLQGDEGDSVPGVEKVGPKTALKLVQQYGSTYDIAANLPLPGKYVYIKNLNAFGADALLLNYKLMDLLEFCEDALGPENCKAIDEVMESYL